MNAGLTFIIADDHPLFRDATKDVVQSGFRNANVVTAGDLSGTIELIDENQDPDLVLLDLNMPGVQGFSGLIYLRNQYPALPIIVVSAAEDHDTIRRVIKLGASGFIPKSASKEAMQSAMRTVLEGDVHVPEGVSLETEANDELLEISSRMASLTPQQVRVLMMLKEGLLNKQIAYELNVSEATVKAHVSAILQKLDVNSRTQAVIVASRLDQNDVVQPAS